MGFDLKDVLANLFDGAYFVDLQRRIIFWNRAAEMITGYTGSEVIGANCADEILRHVDENGLRLCGRGCPLGAVIATGEPREAKLFLHHKDGHRIPVAVRNFPLLNDTGETVGGVELFTEYTDRQMVALRLRELEELALLDPLTRLSNRAHLESELEARFQEKQRYGLSFGLLFIDIDHFKQVNDLHGHSVGDQVLRAVAGTLHSAARPFDLFGRWGGEEFIGIIRNVDLTTLVGIAERCRALIATSTVPMLGRGTRVSISIGATLARADDSPLTLVDRADRLMYRSKEAGRNRVTFDSAAAPISTPAPPI